MLFADDGTRVAPAPRRVAILGMGPTLQDFIHLQLQNPGPGAIVDEVWGMNNVCAAVRCDAMFCMDDLVEMLERPHKTALFWDKSNPLLMQWAREECKIPLITSKAYRPRYPTSVTYPIDEVLKSVFGDHRGFHFSNTTTYAIALAWHLGVREIHLYGTDFAYPWHDPYDRRRYLEAARANVESLLLAGYMLGKFTFHLSARTSLFDTMHKRPFYGYADGRVALPDELITNKVEPQDDTRPIPGGGISDALPLHLPAEARAAAGNEGHDVQTHAQAGNGADPGGIAGFDPALLPGGTVGPAP